jgi:hypothetical protein
MSKDSETANNFTLRLVCCTECPIRKDRIPAQIKTIEITYEIGKVPVVVKNNTTKVYLYLVWIID